MEKVYYKYGLRPIYSEENPKNVIRFYAFQWETGEFEEDFSYRRKINHDLAGDREDLTKEEFDIYVKQLREDRGFEAEE